MKLLQWTLFIDMLGYREANGSICSDKDAEDLIVFMETNKNILEFSDRDEVKNRYNKSNFNLYEYYDINSCFVSDSIIITYKPKEVKELVNEDLMLMHSANALFIICMRLQTVIFNCFADKGIFLRGGISSKYAYIKDGFAVGEGVIEAYLVESSLAKHPRISLHPNIEKSTKLIEKIELLSDAMYGGKSLLQRDSKDGTLFLDHIGFALSLSDLKSAAVANGAVKNPVGFLATKATVETYVHRHCEALKNKLHEIKSRLEQAEVGSEEYDKASRVMSKFIWLKEYHNRSIIEVKGLKDYLVA